MNMKCGDCGTEMVFRRGEIDIDNVSLGSFQLHDVEFWECPACNDQILPAETWTAADQEEGRLIKERISQLPVGDFISAAETAQILDVTRQGLHKNKRIGRGFVYSTMIDGKKFYHKKSVEQFKQTGDGRFALSNRTRRHNPGFFIAAECQWPGQLGR